MDELAQLLHTQAVLLVLDQPVEHLARWWPPSVFPPYSTIGRRRRIEAYIGEVDRGNGADLAYLAGLVAQGRLDPQLGWRGGGEQAAEAAEAFFARRVNGKAVLDVS